MKSAELFYTTPTLCTISGETWLARKVSYGFNLDSLALPYGNEKGYNTPITNQTPRAHETRERPRETVARLRIHSPRAEPLTQDLVTAHAQGDAHVERVLDATAGQPHHLCGILGRYGWPARACLPIGRGWPRLEAALSLILAGAPWAPSFA